MPSPFPSIEESTDAFTIGLCAVPLNVAVITLSNGTSVAPSIGSVLVTAASRI